MLPLLILLLVLQAVEPQRGAEVDSAAEISGRITDRETGQPLARAIVRLQSKDGREQRSAHTDHAGFYRFTGLPPGEYSGFVEAGEFRGTHSESALMDSSGAPGGRVVLRAGQRREVSVALSKTVAAVVRIVDEWGDPLSGIGVTVHSADNHVQMGSSMGRTSDDRGRLRVFGLGPGRYLLCAEPRAFATSEWPVWDRPHDALLHTCFPSASDELAAEPVQIGRSDAGEFEIRMRRGRTFTISGIVVDSNGAPAPAALVNFMKSTLTVSWSTGITANSDGRFTLANVHPGQCTIEARLAGRELGGREPSGWRRSLEAGFVNLVVDSSDVTDLVVPLKRTADVSGRVVLEYTDDPFPAPADSTLRVSSRLAEDRPSPAGFSQALVSADLTFTLGGVFGRRRVDVHGVPRGWYVKSIRYGSTEVIDAPVEFKVSPDAPSLEVLLSNRGATVHGRVVDDIGNPVARGIVLVLADEGDGKRFRLAASGRSKEDGTFRIAPLRAGEYRVAAIHGQAPMLQEWERDRTAQLAADGERVVLGELDDRLVDVRVLTTRLER